MKNVLTLAALTLLVAACSSGQAYDNGYQSGDSQFNSAQTK